MVVGAVVVTVLSMALQTPSTAVSAYMVFFVTKENRASTTLAAVFLTLGVTLSIGLSLFLYRYTFGFPELRVPMMAAMLFLGMYLSRVFVIGPLGFALGFVIAVTQSVAGVETDPETLVRMMLWLWVVVVFPVVVAVIVNQVLLPVRPWSAFAEALTKRFNATSSALNRADSEGGVAAPKNPMLLDLATRGSKPLLGLFKLAAINEPRLKQRSAVAARAIAASERMVSAAAALEITDRQPLSPNDRRCAEALLTRIAQLQTAVRERHVPVGGVAVLPSAPDLPELREIDSATTTIGHSLAGQDSGISRPVSGKAKRHLFAPDAFTNPDHIRFSLKVTLAAMICYLIYTGLDWSGIHTAFITCIIIGLESTGATIRKGRLRICGCLLGGLLGFLSILYLIPHMESIVSLAILTAAVSALAGWVAAGSERISYGGLQIALAFFLCVFQGFAPDTGFVTIRDRIVGIVLGILVTSCVFHYIWPERARDKLRLATARMLRDLGRLVLVPEMNAPAGSERVTAAELRGRITMEIDQARKLTELAALEVDEAHPQWRRWVVELADVVEHAQGAYVMADILSGEAGLEERSHFDAAARAGEAAFRSRVADCLNRAASAIELGHRPLRSDLESSFAVWAQAASKAPKSDRFRLLRRLVDEVQHLATS
jgi:multidrug resistance protein MdtO